MNLRCPVCGGTELDLPRSIVPYAGGVPLVYLLNGDQAHRATPEYYTRVKGRACLSCGFVLMCVDPDKLRLKLSRLAPSRPAQGSRVIDG